MKSTFFIFFLVFIYFLNHLIKKKKFLKNYKNLAHQKLVGNIDVPLTGGSFLILFFFINFYSNNLLLLIFLTGFFLIGFFSDNGLISSPSIRLVLQFSLILFFVIIFKINITDLRVDLINNYLSYYYLSIFFTAFCFLVLINGSNFIDGNNTLLLGYYLLVFLTIYLTNNFIPTNIETNFLNFLILFMFFLFLMNFFEKLFMGDSGAYLLSIFIGYICVNIYNNSSFISPYFIALLLWYPAFENLFSILRKLNFKRSPLKPDTNHLHQLIYFYLKQKKVFSNLNLNNSMTSILINGYNLFIFFISFQYIEKSNVQIILILINVSVYIVIYYRLLLFKRKIV